MIVFLMLGLGVFLVIMGFLSEKKPQLIAGWDVNNPDKEMPKRIKKTSVVAGIILIVGGAIAYVSGMETIAHWMLILIPLLMPLFFIGKKSKKTLVLYAGIIVIVISFLIYSLMPQSVKIEKNTIEIKGLYGEVIPVNEVASVDLLNSIPEITQRVNGFAFSNIRKGNFLVDGIGQVKLFTESDKGPFIMMKTLDKQYIVNMRNSIATVAVYENIIQSGSGNY